MWDPVWEDIFRSREWGKYPSEDLIRFVARRYYQAPDRAGVRILEVGCGPGANLWYLAREGFSFAGVDGSAAAIGRAGERLDSECPGWRQRGELAICDIAKLPFGDEDFDAVIDIEAPALEVATVNIGARQDGRMRASSIVDCGENTDQIVGAVVSVLTPEFKAQLHQRDDHHANAAFRRRVRKSRQREKESPCPEGRMEEVLRICRSI